LLVCYLHFLLPFHIQCEVFHLLPVPLLTPGVLFPTSSEQPAYWVWDIISQPRTGRLVTVKKEQVSLTYSLRTQHVLKGAQIPQHDTSHAPVTQLICVT
jgi:hypothetical protein